MFALTSASVSVKHWKMWNSVENCSGKKKKIQILTLQIKLTYRWCVCLIVTNNAQSQRCYQSYKLYRWSSVTNRTKFVSFHNIIVITYNQLQPSSFKNLAIGLNENKFTIYMTLGKINNSQYWLIDWIFFFFF